MPPIVLGYGLILIPTQPHGMASGHRVDLRTPDERMVQNEA
jgi:hypothetical protein